MSKFYSMWLKFQRLIENIQRSFFLFQNKSIFGLI